MPKRRIAKPRPPAAGRVARSANVAGPRPIGASEAVSRALLPPGFADGLPPDAAVEVETTERLMASMARYGYERVKPPLIEFEDSLLAGSGGAMAADTFRLMDPASQRMLGLRPDMTLQIGRIASTRLKDLPRPLRLSYCGQVLRVRGSSLRSARQFGQVGAELIGSESPAADAEAVRVATEALGAVGLGELSVDLGLPTLVPAVARGFGLDAASLNVLRAALDRKDAAQIATLGRRFGRDAARIFSALLTAAGPARRGLEQLASLTLPPEAAVERDTLAQVAAAIQASTPEITLTIDPTDNRGFEYHTGVTTAFFARRVRGELGRGGRYRVGFESATTEPATGFTLFMDTVLGAVPPPPAPPRLYAPRGTSESELRRLRSEGWIVVSGLEPVPSADAEARRLGCSHLFRDGSARPLI